MTQFLLGLWLATWLIDCAVKAGGYQPTPYYDFFFLVLCLLLNWNWKQIRTAPRAAIVVFGMWWQEEGPRVIKVLGTLAAIMIAVVGIVVSWGFRYTITVRSLK